MDNIVETQVLSLVDGFINTMMELQNSDPDKELELYENAEEQLLALADKALYLLGGREEYLEAMLNQLISQKLPQGPIMDSFGNFKEEVDHVVSRSLETFREKKNASMLSEEKGGSAEDNTWVEDVNEAHEVDEPDESMEANESIEEIEEMEEIEASETGGVLAEQDVGEKESAESEGSDGDYEIEEVNPVTNITSQEETAAGEDLEPEEPIVEEGERVDEDPLGLLLSLIFTGEEIIPQMEFADMVFDYYIPKYSLAFFDGSEGMVSISHLGDLALRRSGIWAICVDPSKVYNVKAFKRDVRRIISQKDLEEKRVFRLYAE